MATRTTRSYCIRGDNRNGVCAGTPALVVTRQRAGLMIRCAVQYDAVLPSTPPTWDLGPVWDLLNYRIWPYLYQPAPGPAFPAPGSAPGRPARRAPLSHLEDPMI